MNGAEQICSYSNRVQTRGGPQTGICNGVQKSLEIIGSKPQGHTCLECWQPWPIVGGAGNGAAEEDWRWDLSPGTAAIWRLFLRPHTFGGGHAALGCCLFATWLRKQERLCLEEKG